MDDFKYKAIRQNSIFDGTKNKKFGRKAARRSSKQTNWMEHFYDVNYPSGWEFGGMFCDDYDYYDDLDIHEATIDWYFENKDDLNFTYGISE